MYACPHGQCLDAQRVVFLSQPSEIWDCCCFLTEAKLSTKLGKNALPKVLSCGRLDFSAMSCGLSLYLQHHTMLLLERRLKGEIMES